jgi:hypothetical protein
MQLPAAFGKYIAGCGSQRLLYNGASGFLNYLTNKFTFRTPAAFTRFGQISKICIKYKEKFQLLMAHQAKFLLKP